MDLKTVEIDGKTYAEVQDGKPVYVDGEKELPMDVPAMSTKIKDLGSEAKGHREAKEKAEKQLKAFEGIEDPEAAIKALDTVKNLDDKKLVDAGEVEKVKAEAIKAVEEKYKPITEKAEVLEEQLRQEKIGGSFARSQFISEKLAVPVPMVEKTFGDHFSIEEGKIVAKDANGNQIYSKERPGEPASFDEAMEVLVEQSPYKDNIMKGRGHNGSGAPGGGGGGAGSKTMTRAQYEEMRQSDPAAARKAILEDGVKVTD
jgi:hypothetical protein